MAWLADYSQIHGKFMRSLFEKDLGQIRNMCTKLLDHMSEEEKQEFRENIKSIVG